MFLRAAIVMLVMLDLGAAGWWAFQPAARTQAPTSANAPTLRLLGEADGAPVAAPGDAAPAPAVAPLPVAPPTQDASDAVPAAAVCLRFGPFDATGARDAARAALSAAGVSAIPRETAPRKVRAWKVFLPAQATREAAVALADRLKAAGVKDLFVMTQGEEANTIALGRFSSEAGARRRQAELQGKGVQASAEPVGGTPGQAWLDARLPQGADRALLARLAPSQALDCATLP